MNAIYKTLLESENICHDNLVNGLGMLRKDAIYDARVSGRCTADLPDVRAVE